MKIVCRIIFTFIYTSIYVLKLIFTINVYYSMLLFFEGLNYETFNSFSFIFFLFSSIYLFSCLLNFKRLHKIMKMSYFEVMHFMFMWLDSIFFPKAKDSIANEDLIVTWGWRSYYL